MALQVAAQVLPPYRNRFSKHQLTQPQLLAVLCLMRYEEGTFREAELGLNERQEWRAVWNLQAVRDYTTLYRFLRRLEDHAVERGWSETVRRLRRRRRRAVSRAIDGTGLSYNAVSTHFLRRLEQHADGTTRHGHWLKWLARNRATPPLSFTTHNSLFPPRFTVRFTRPVPGATNV
jgi:hypothetical protein